MRIRPVASRQFVSLVIAVALLPLFAGTVMSAEKLPAVPEGFRVAVFAREPAIRNPASMAFDAQGRLFVGQGPQFRHPTPDTPGDSIKILIDADEDGKVDEVKTFATGFNCIQSLAFKGRDLWVANSPDLTVVRDLDGDDRADEYVLVYTDLGNLEHGLHGLNWAPDGRLYMSKGNSKGLTQPGRIAPKPFRDLWDVKAPPDAPDLPAPRVFTDKTYKKHYHNPADDWGHEGGVLRCDADGKNLEIVCRGMRNPWDITLDDGFHWLGTDNDQTEGDKIMMPAYGAHFGWGHPWSYHWSGAGHLPTVPISGPLFHGSGTGIVYYNAPQFPTRYRDLFFINDWSGKVTYAYRPRWDGALRQPVEGKLEAFASHGGALFNPTDIEVGPDGSLYVLGWGSGYGVRWNDGEQENQGRVFRIWYEQNPLRSRSDWHVPNRDKPLGKWSFSELAADLGHHIPAWRVNAQDELVRRGEAVVEQIKHLLESPNLSKAQQTWAAWTLGRIAPGNASIDRWLAQRVSGADDRDLNLRIQAIRILAYRIANFRRQTRLPEPVVTCLVDREPRIRFEAVQAIWQARQDAHVDALQILASRETDRLTFYTAWNALADLASPEALKAMLRDEQGGVRRAALLALTKIRGIGSGEVEPLRLDEDAGVSQVASLWLSRHGKQSPPLLSINPPGGEFVESMRVTLASSVAGAAIHYTLDGTAPSAKSARYYAPLSLTADAALRAVLFRDGRRIGPLLSAAFHKRTAEELQDRLFVGNLAARSGNSYRAVADGLKTGALTYTDRRYAFTQVPDELVGATYIMTSNADDGSRGDALLTFSTLYDVIVYVGHDARMPRPPGWMKVDQAGGFQPTGTTLVSNDATFRLFRKPYKAGTITLGGNTDDGASGGKSQYVIVVDQPGLQPLATATTAADVMPILNTADPQRGRALFFARRGANCSGCHRIDGRGNNYAPNLSDLGLRAKPPAVVQSILEPSAVITEGFHTQLIVTEAGRQYAGIVVEESGLSLKLVQTDGRVRVIAKQDVDARRSSKTSAMPANFNRLLSPQQVADLTAYLMTRKTRLATTPRAGAKTKPAPKRKQPEEPKPKAKSAAPNEFTFDSQPGELRISLGGKPMASYLYRDPVIRRPYLAHVKSPAGIQATRNHPPVKGKDSQDHNTMHPGIWLAFGDLGGADFWRNKAQVEHERFAAKPQGGPGRGTFSVVNRYLSGEKVVCRETCTVTFLVQPSGTLIIYDSSFTSDEADFAIGAQEEMGLGIRVATPLAVQSGGQITSADGRKNEKEVWGRQADWCDYSGDIDGRHIGMTLMPDPANFVRCWFHARDYGVLVANPFGPRAGGPARKTVKRGESLRMRFGVLLHASTDATAPDLAKAYQAFLAEIREK